MMQEAKIRYHKKKLNTYGAFKSMFSFDAFPNLIIKTWKPESDSSVKEEYETSIQYPDLYAKIVKINFDKRWMAQEKLDTNRVFKELDDLADIFGMSFRSSVVRWLETLAINKREKEKAIETIKQNFPEQLETFNRWLDFFSKTLLITTKYILDLNSGNMGYDKEGNLKLLDI